MIWKEVEFICKISRTKSLTHLEHAEHEENARPMWNAKL